MKLASDYFDEIWNEYINDRQALFTSETEAKYFFAQGRRSAQSEQSKRKIVQLIKTDQGWFSLADTGEWFYLVRPLDSECHWVKYPDLPQD